MFCPKCGSEIADGAKFCPSCGAKIVPAGDASKAPLPDVPEHDASEAQPPEATAPEKGADKAPRPNAPRKKAPIFLIAAVVALVVAGVIEVLRPWDSAVGSGQSTETEQGASSEQDAAEPEQGRWLLTSFSRGYYTGNDFYTNERYEYERDASGLIVSFVYDNYDTDEKVEYQLVYTKDGDVQCIDEVAGESFPNDIQPGTRIARWTCNESSGGSVSDVELRFYQLDEQGNVEGLDPNSGYTCSLRYDEDGIPRSYSYAIHDGSSTLDIESNGLLAQSYSYVGDSADNTWNLTWSYDSEVRPTHGFLKDEQTGQTQECVIRYEDNGNISEICVVGGDRDGQAVRFEWEYFEDPDSLTRLDYVTKEVAFWITPWLYD